MTNLVKRVGFGATGNARIRRAMVVRGALLTTTALVGVAMARPAAAQTVTPAGGGTVTTTGGSITGGGTNGGVLVQQNGGGGVTVTGINITNTGTTPTPDGLRVVGPGGQGVGLGIAGTSTITSQSGDGVRLQGGNGENTGFGVSAGQTLNVTGINGVNITSTGGLFLADPGTAGTIVATARTNGSGTGLLVSTSGGFGGSFGSVSATGFATGIGLTGNGLGPTIEGGTISATQTGISLNSSANVILLSQATITAPTGISVTAATGGTIATSGGGTINSTAAGTGTGITVTNSGDANPVGITIGAAIGGTTSFATGVAATTAGGTGTITVTSNAAITATTAISVAGANATTINLNTGSTTTGNVTSTGAGARTVNVASTLTGSYTATGTGATTVNLSAGSISGNVAMGNTAGVFNWAGGTLGGSLTGGNNLSTFNFNVGAGQTRTLSSIGRFFGNVQSGTLILNNESDLNGSWNVSDGALLRVGGSFTHQGGTFASLQNAGGSLQIDAGATLTNASNINVSSGNAAKPITITILGTLNGATSGGSANSFLGAINNNGGGYLNIVNSGTLTSGNNNKSGAVTHSGGTTNISNTGTIAGGNVGSTATAYGAVVQGGTLTLNNMTAASVLRGADAGILQIVGTLNVSNAGALSGTTTGINSIGGVLNITANTGTIAGGTNAINASGSGAVAITNNGGTIGTGTITGGTFTAGGTGDAIVGGSGSSIDNSGTITGAARGVSLPGADTYAVVNRAGTIAGSSGDGVTDSGVLTLVNAKGATISSATTSAVAILVGGSGTITNGGTLSVGSGGNNASAFQTNSTRAVTFNNYGSLGGAIAFNSGALNINLFAGSTTGAITGGSGNDTLALYNGAGTGNLGTTYNTATNTTGAGTTSDATHVLVQNAGMLNAATFGEINLGGGTDTMQLRGTGDGNGANGAAGSFSIATSTGAEVLTKADAGTWTLTGAAITPAITINAGIGGTPGSGGLLIFNGTTGLTGSIVVNGGTIRSNSAGAFGTGTIYAADPTVQYAATTTEANNIVLQTADPVGDPTRLQVGNGVTATLTGLISQGTAGQPNMGGQTIAATQPLILEQIGGTGTGTFVLTNGSNDYNGLTTINTGTTVIERNVGTALGSGGVSIATGATVQIDNQTGASLGLDGGTYSGTGTLAFTGNAGSITDIGYFSTTTNIGLSVGGLIDVRSGRVAGSSNSQGFWTNNQGDLNVAAGALFRTSEGQVRVDGLTGAGQVQIDGSGSLTVGVGGVAATAATFSGTIADQGSAGSLTKTGAGTQTLTGANTYTGATTVNGGTLAVSGGAAIGDTSAVTVTTPGTLALLSSETIASLAGNGAVTLAASELTVGGSNASTTFSGTITGSGAIDTTLGYQYVGQFAVGSGPSYSTRPIVYSGVGAAALLFGGSASDYAISTVSANPAQINHMAFVDGYGVHDFTPRAETFSASDPDGRYGYANGQSSFSAYVRDADNGTHINYVFAGQNIALNKVGTGTLILTGANNYTGITMVSAGTLQGTTASISGSSVVDNATLAYVQPASGTEAKAISGTGVVTVSGLTAGNTLTFTGALTNTGGVTVSGTSNTAFNAGVAGGILENGAGDRTLTIAGNATNATASTSGSGLFVQTTSGTTTVNINAGATLATTATSGNRDGITALSNTVVINNGTVSSSYNAGIALAGGGSITSNGTITGGNGSNGYGIAVSNGAAATVTLQAGSTVSGTQGGVAFQSTGTGANRATLSNAGQITSGRYGVEASTTGTPGVTNLGTGKIVGGAAGVYSAGTAAISNAGTIGTGSVNAGGAFTVGGAGFAVQIASGAVTNTGILNSTGASVYQMSATGTLNLVNTGTIGGAGRAIDPDDTVVANGAAMILNSGTITTPNFYAVGLANGGTVTNAAGGLISAGTQDNNRYGVNVTGASATVNNYGTIRSTSTDQSRGIQTDNNAATINLFAGSTTGAITTGAGNDTLTLYNGRGTASGATTQGYTDAVSGAVGTITLQNAGTLAAAAYGPVNLGGGSNTLNLNGTGDGTAANGAAATLNVATIANITTIAKNDTGTWTLSGVNTGTTTVVNINAGLLNVTGGNAVANTAAVTVASGGTFGLLANETIGTLAGAGNVSLAANTLTLAGNGNTTFSGMASGAGGILKQGTGTLTLSGANSFTGTLEIAGGTVAYGANNVLADTSTVTVDANTIFNLNGFSDTIGTLNLYGTLANGGALTAMNYNAYAGSTIGQSITGGTLNVYGNTTLTSSNTANPVNIYSGTLTTGAAELLGDTSAVNIASGGTLSLGGAETIGSLADLAYNGTTNGGSVANNGFLLTVGGAGTDTSFSGVISGAGGLSKSGVGTQTLAGVNTFTGTTTIDGGTLALTGGNALADTGAVVVNAGGTLGLLASETIGTLAGAGSVSLGANTLTVAGSGSTTFSGVASGSGGLVKAGGGALTLSGANGYTGATVVSGGVLALGAGDVLADATAVSVGSGAVLDLGANSDTVATLQLNGTLAGTGGTLSAVSYLLNGATVTGNLGAGVLTQAGGVSTLTGTAGAGTVAVTGGTLALGAGERLADTAALSVASGATLDLRDYNETVGSAVIAGTLDSTPGRTGTLSAATYTLDGGIFPGAASNPVINGNLGAGALVVQGKGVSTLNGTAGAASVAVTGATLRLGASERLLDSAAVRVTSGANGPGGTTAGVLDIGGFVETVGSLQLTGSRLDGTGTLSAATYGLDTGTVNANLGTGVLTQNSGVSTLNGMAGAATVNVLGGTLALGAADRLADTAAVSVASGAVLDLGMFSDTVGTLALGGSLNGTGTLSAASYTLNGGTVNANLGAGVLSNAGGVSTLNGTAGAGTVAVNAGTLTLGAANRLADASAVSVASGAILNLGAFSDTVGTLALNGSLNGTGTLSAASYTLNGGTANANLGAGVLSNAGGVSTLNGTAGATTVTVAAGTLALGAANRLADASAVSVAAGAVLDLGMFSDTVAALGLNGTLAGSGTLSAATYKLNGGTANANLGAGALSNVGGSSTLNGTAGAATVDVTAGTLALGAANRLADTAAVSVASGATLDLRTFSDTVGTVQLNGTLAGTGTLTAASYALNGATVNANLGTGTLSNAGGVSTLNGTSNAATVTVSAGTLALGAGDRLADASAVTVASGATLDLRTFSDTVGTVQLNGTLNGTGTLTAASYNLNGAAVNGNLGAGTLTNAGGSSTLIGATGAATVNVAAGTLALGAANRLADASAVSVAQGAILDLGAFSDTVGTVQLNGTLNGTGTLSAASYTLNAAAVNGNLGAGVLTQAGGTSTLTGSSLAATVTVTAGTLRLGADERLLDTGAVSVASGAVLDLNGRTETVASVTGAGTVALGAGRLVLAGSGGSSLGALTGSGTVDKTGTGTLTLANSYAGGGSINTAAGTTAFTGQSAGSLRVTGGSLTGTGTAAGALTVTGGTVAPGTAAAPFGTLTVGSLAMSGGTYAIEFGGPASGYASDLIRVTGAAALGGMVSVTNSGFVPTDRFQQTYTVVQAGSLTGTFGNYATFTQSATDPALFYRLRYDLVPNAVVLQVQRQIDFAAAVPGGTANQLAFGRALTGAAGNASDSFAATLNAIAVSGGDRGATYDSLSGEAIADVTTGALFVGDQFLDLLRARVGLRGGGVGGAAQYALRAGVGDGQRHANGFAGALEDGVEAGGGSASSSGGGVWLQGQGAGQRLRGLAGQARTDSFVSGLAGGADGQIGNLSAGIAGGFSDLDTHVRTRGSTIEGTLYQGGAYVAYDSGTVYGQLAGDYYGGDVTVRRQLAIGGGVVGQATGTTNVHGYTVGGLLGARAELGGGTRAGVELTAQETQATRRAYTETAPLGLGLTAARDARDVFTGTAQVKLSHLFTGRGWTAEPFASGGVEIHAGDLATIDAMQLGAAPTGTGGFLVQGATIERTLGVFTGGVEIRPSDKFRIDLSTSGKIGNRTREGQIKVSARVAF